MNKNENKQFLLFKKLVKENKQNKEDIFNGALKVSMINMKGYDALVEFNDKKIYVQLTTMSNWIAKKNGKIQHAKNMNFDLEPTFNEKDINEKNEYLATERGIKRKTIKAEENAVHVRDEYTSIFPIKEEDGDSKLQSTNSLSDALCRALKKKKDKYSMEDKQNQSCLVIIDECFGRYSEKPIVKKYPPPFNEMGY